MKLAIVILILSFFLACKKKMNDNAMLSEKRNLTQVDTLFFPKANEKCLNNFSGYRNQFGMQISNFYIRNKIIIDSNKDSIAILKPYYLSNDEKFSNCVPEKIDKNILIIKKVDSKTEIYYNLLFTDDRDVFQEVKVNKKGFIIYSEQGNSSKLFSSIYISNNKIDSLKIESWGFKQYELTYKFENMSLKMFNVAKIDSLQVINDLKK